MNINNENINEFLDKYVDFISEICNKKNYPENIRHVFYLILPAFIIKYGLKEERNILSCFDSIPIYIGISKGNGEVAFFNRGLYSVNEGGQIKYLVSKEIVINDYYNVSLVELMDNIIHEFNHAINSIKNEIKIGNDEISLRTGLSYINFYKYDMQKVKSRSKDIALEEVINTTQTEAIINIINSFNNYNIKNEEIKNALYSIKQEVSAKGYQSKAYFFQAYICKELLNNRTFMPTIEYLRYNGNIDGIEEWFDNIVNIPKSYQKMITLLNEILEEEEVLNKNPIFRKYKMNNIIAKSKSVLEIIQTFDKNCIFK